MKRLSLLLLAGCVTWVPPAQKVDLPVRYVCVDGPTEGVTAACELWSRVLPFALVPVRSAPECWATVTEVEGSEATIGVGAYREGSAISLVRENYRADASWFVAHELGHVLGAQHARGTMMAPVWEPGLPRCPGRSTVADVASAQGLPLSQFGWCQ